MARDPLEGIAADGFITTGADPANIKAPYDTIIDDATITVRDELGEDLHSLYLYGSIATGQARPPQSDVDLLAVVFSKVAAGMCAHISSALSGRYDDLVRTVWIAPTALDDVLDEDQGLAERCFIKHYCVHLTGHDLRPSLPRCTFSAELARAFNSDLASHLEEGLRRLETAGDPAGITNIAQTSSKRLLMAAAVALSTTRGRWSTDRGLGRQLLVEDYPERAEQTGLAHRWARMGEALPGGGDLEPTRREVGMLLNDWGWWLVDELQHRLTPGGGQ